MNQLITVTVAEAHFEGEHSRSFRLVPESASPLPAFEAGAHIDVYIPEGFIRQYSLANDPRERDSYLICVKREEKSRGGSAYLYDYLKVGDRLRISPPRNHFQLQEAAEYLLIGGGIGITPLLAMAETLDHQKKPFVLHYYTSSEDFSVFMARLRKGFSSGQIFIHYSSQGDSLRHNLPAELLRYSPDTQLYHCGPQSFMEKIATEAQKYGWKADHIHSEAFSAVIALGDANEESFEVELVSTQKVITVTPTQSIAEALDEAGIEISLACEEGVCGACLVGLISGQGDHRDFVQSDEEKASNKEIALCCSRSRSKRLVIDL
ncbi:MAG: PDR/VanB family oxidoreductase [Zymomonas mobilis subsp. pomaceae]|uniref:PDR/VanB family oxidoreductase n=1 Tax=Zymomonas mobilis TaxID=542 RepID=UPI0039EA62A2